MSKGFIYRTFTVIGGTEEFPLGDTDLLRRQRSETILSKFANNLIDCNVGWQLDTSKNSTVTDFTDIPTKSTSKKYPGLFFVNTISGCKLFISYFGDDNNSNGIKDFSGNDLFRCLGDSAYSGVCCSMIPEGSNSEFGDPNTSSFIPNDATRIYGTFCFHTSVTPQYPAAYNPKDTYHYQYYILATPCVLCIYANYGVNVDPGLLYVPIYATGRIFEKVFHEESSKNSLYGTYAIRQKTDSYEGWSGYAYTSVIVNNQSFKIPSYTSFNINSDYPQASVSKEDGSWLLGSESKYGVYAYCPDYALLSTCVFNRTDATRWIPIYIIVISSELETYGITEGDGLKGILDTNLFRCAIGNRGQIFNKYKFICVENNINFIIGWDFLNNENGYIDTTYGSPVTIPEGYRIESVKSKWTFEFNDAELLSDSVVIKGKGQDEYCKGDLSSAIGLNVLPCLYIFQVTGVNSDNSINGYRISVSPSKYNSGCPSAITETATNVNGNFFELRAYYDSSSAQAIYNAIHDSNYPSTVHYYDETDTEVFFLDLPQAFWKYEGGVFSWLGDPEDRSSLAFYYRKCVPEGTPVRIHCVPI